MNTERSRSHVLSCHWPGFLSLSALLFALPLLAPPAQAQIQGETQLVAWPKGWSGGIRAGGIIGQTELASKIAPQFRGYLRHFILPHLAAEIGAGYGRLSGDEYSTDMEMGDMKLLFTPFKGPFLKPYFYGGVGLVRFNLDHIAQSRSPDTRALDYTWTAPAGVGLELRLLDNVGLDLSGGYTHTFTDDLDAVRKGAKKDAFWNMSVGLVIRDITTVFKRAPRLVKAPVAPSVDAGRSLANEAAQITLSSEALKATDAVVVAVAAVAPAVVPAAAPKTVVEILAPGPVYFGTNSASLTAAARAQLDVVITEMAKHVDLLLDVHGYTDPVGTRADNLILAGKRAKAVEAYLVEKGIPAWRLHVQAMGQAEPRTTTAADAKSRRVELTLREPASAPSPPTN